MSDQYTTVTLKPGKEQSIKRFHPWIFSGAIKKINGKVYEGDLVEVVSNDGEFLALGHYQIGSIAVRIFSFKKAKVDLNFWKQKLQQAWEVRKLIGFENNPETNVFRLVHGEGDEMPGLVIDYYNGVCVLQMHSVGMYIIRDLLVEALQGIFGKKLKAIYDKSSKSLPFKADIQSVDGYLFGETSACEVVENGLKFIVDPEDGQKTGFFIDQRENRKLLKTYSRNRDVLNMFCYTGGFSMYALKGGAKSVHSVDSSSKAIELTNQNTILNFPDDSRHKAILADGMEYLKDINEKYDLIILDPPAFAKHRDSLSQALQAYKRINTRAFEQIKSGGVLFTFSCSQVVSKEKFREAVFTAAAISGRSVRILHQLQQPADHPVSIYHPEGEYLKGLVLYVE